jgi:hypothetical protein
VALLLRSVLPDEHLGTLIAAFFVCALSIFGAIFVILELDQSFEGLLQVSRDPLRAALAQLGQ